MLNTPVLTQQYATYLNNLDNYLHQVKSTLSNFDPSLYSRHGYSLAQLKQTLLDLEIAHIKHTAITQGIWDFYPTPKLIIQKMITIAQLQPCHNILEPSAGSGDLAKAITLTGVSNLDCFELHPLLQNALRLQDFNIVGKKMNTDNIDFDSAAHTINFSNKLGDREELDDWVHIFYSDGSESPFQSPDLKIAIVEDCNIISNVANSHN